MKHIKTLNCIGYSRVAKALLPIFESIGVQIVGLTNRTALHDINHCYQSIWVDHIQDLPKADLWLIAVSDLAIAPVAQRCALSSNIKAGDVVVHFSGALADDVLLSLKNLGAHCLSAHPIFTFHAKTHLALPLSFPFSLCGDLQAQASFKYLLGLMGARSVVIEHQHKILYHALCVMASNYIFAYGACLKQLSSNIGLDNIEEMLGPLMKESLYNYQSEGIKRLSGPIVREDWDMVDQHIKALSSISPEVTELYKAFANVLKVALHPSQKQIESVQRPESEQK